MEHKIKRFVALFSDTHDDGHDFFPRDCWLETDEENKKWIADALDACVWDNARDDFYGSQEMVELSDRFYSDADFNAACKDAVWKSWKPVIEKTIAEEKEEEDE